MFLSMGKDEEEPTFEEMLEKLNENCFKNAHAL